MMMMNANNEEHAVAATVGVTGVSTLWILSEECPRPRATYFRRLN